MLLLPLLSPPPLLLLLLLPLLLVRLLLRRLRRLLLLLLLLAARTCGEQNSLRRFGARALGGPCRAGLPARPAGASLALAPAVSC